MKAGGVPHLALSDEVEADVTERNEVARCANCSALRDTRYTSTVEQLHEALQGLSRNPTVALGDAVDAKSVYSSGGLEGKYLADAGGV